MIVMAVEGIRQITAPERSIKGFKIQNLVFDSALVLNPADEGTECHMHFQNRKAMVYETSNSGDFTLYAFSNEAWVPICHSIVIAEFEEPRCDLSDYVGRDDRLENPVQIMEVGTRNCKEAINSQQFYRNLTSIGFNFGPTFRSLNKIRYTETGEVTASIRLDEWMEKLDLNFSSDHVIHPTALDGILQVSMAAISKGSWEFSSAHVPTRVDSMWISAELLARSPKSEVQAYTRTTFEGYRDAEFWISATNADDQLMVLVEGWRMTALNSSEISASKLAKLGCYHILWKPDPALIDASQVERYCESTSSDSGRLDEATVDHWELVCLLYISETMKIVP